MLLMKNIGNLFVRRFVISLLTFRYFSTIVSLFGAGAAPFFTAPAPAPASSKPFRRLRLRLRLRLRIPGLEDIARKREGGGGLEIAPPPSRVRVNMGAFGESMPVTAVWRGRRYASSESAQAGPVLSSLYVYGWAESGLNLG